MHINEAKQKIKDFLKEEGWTPFGPKAPHGDYRLYPASDSKRILISVINDKFLKFLEKNVRHVVEKHLPGATYVIDNTKAFITNPNWSVEEIVLSKSKRGYRAKKSNDSNSLGQISPEEGKEAFDVIKGGAFENSNEKKSLEKADENSYDRLESMVQRMEKELDDLKLNRMSLKEIVSNLYDMMKESGFEIYSVDVGISLQNGTLIVPHIARDAFIAKMLKSRKFIRG